MSHLSNFLSITSLFCYVYEVPKLLKTRFTQNASIMNGYICNSNCTCISYMTMHDLGIHVHVLLRLNFNFRLTFEKYQKYTNPRF